MSQEKKKGMLSSFLPLPAAKYLEDVFFRGEGGTSINLEELSEPAKKLLMKIIKEQGEGVIDLKRNQDMYKKYGDDFSGGLDHLFTPYGQLRNTLGAFNVNKNEEGEYILEDTYDWSKDYASMDKPGDLLNRLGKLAYDYGGTREGEGTPYRMNLGMLTGN